ncbi:MAG: sulfatase-like hydrolase/transferase [Bacteroidota bacterium]
MRVLEAFWIRMDEFGQTTIVLALMLPILVSCDRQQREATRPNTFNKVVVILSDDHAHHVTGSYGNDRIRTPNIDRLAAEGIRFTNAYCNAPICSASRQSLLTGKYPMATGVNLLFTPFPDHGNETIAEFLGDRGYQTALIGKSHFNNWAWQSLYEEGLPNHGFQTIIDRSDHRRYLDTITSPRIPSDIATYDRASAKASQGAWMNADVLPHPIRDEHSLGTFLARQAISFLEDNKDQPFLLWLAFHEPHHPYYFPIEYQGKYDPTDMPLPEGSAEDDRWIPQKYRSLTDDERRGIIASYYTSTEYMDKNVGLVLDAIDDLDLDDETIVLYLSDNGYLLNDHKRFEKHTLWKEAVKQPTALRIPGFEPGMINELVEYVDVTPTLIDLLGVRVPDAVQGRSLLALINGTNSNHRDYVFSCYLEDNMAMVRTDSLKYIFHTGSRDLGIGYATGYGPSGMFHRLYDVVRDPEESRNLANDRAYATHLESLQQLMLRHFLTHHPDADRCPETLTTVGKLVWFCEPRDVGTDQSSTDTPVRVIKKD